MSLTTMATNIKRGQFFALAHNIANNFTHQFGFTIISFLAVFAILLCALSVALPQVSAAGSGAYLVINSRDWRDLYLGTAYAGLRNETVISFTNLGEAQLMSKIIPPGSIVTVLEPSKNPVVKNYASYLGANGISASSVISYDNYIDLQSTLFARLQSSTVPDAQSSSQSAQSGQSRAISGYAIFYAQYGVEAIDMAPRLYTDGLWPLFVDENSVQQFVSSASAYPRMSVIVSGHMPVRVISAISQLWNVSELYTSYQENNSLAIEQHIGSTNPAKIGILMEVDKVDLASLVQPQPQFAYYGSQADVAAQIAASNVQILEIIGSGAADLARPIGQLSGKNLRYLVKYARGFSNIPGLSGQLLDLDTVSFPYEFVQVTLDAAVYHPQTHTLTVTVTNHGTAPALTYSTIEFGQGTYSDNINQLIPPKTSITIPYKVDDTDLSVNKTTISTLYGEYAPLKNSVLAANGQPIVILPVSVDNNPDPAVIGFVGSAVDDQAGQLHVTVQNNGSAQALVTAQLSRGDVALAASAPTPVLAQSQADLIIPVPYLSTADVLKAPFNLTLYYGLAQTIKLQSQNVTVTKVITHGPAVSVWIIIIVVIIVLIALAVLYLRRRR